MSFGASSDNDLIYGNSVTVNGGSVTCTGNGTSSSNEYVASFYNTDNTLSFSGTEISASGNTSEAFFIYSFVTYPDAPYAAYRPGDAEPVSIDGVSFNGFMIEATGEKFINIYSSLAEAVSAAEAGNTVVLGQDTS